MAKFTVGQRVSVRGMEMPGEITSGPHKTVGAVPRWLVTKADGNVSLLRETELSAVRTPAEVAADIIARKVYMVPIGDLVAGSQHKCRDAANAVLAEIGKAKPLAVGDRIRILERNHNAARVNVGDILTVQTVDSSGEVFSTNAPRNSLMGSWYFRSSTEGKGWERV